MCVKRLCLITVGELYAVCIHISCSVPGNRLCILIYIELYQLDILLHIAGILHNGKIGIYFDSALALYLTCQQTEIGDINFAVCICIGSLQTFLIQ